MIDHVDGGYDCIHLMQHCAASLRRRVGADRSLSGAWVRSQEAVEAQATIVLHHVTRKKSVDPSSTCTQPISTSLDSRSTTRLCSSRDFQGPSHPSLLNQSCQKRLLRRSPLLVHMRHLNDPARLLQEQAREPRMASRPRGEGRTIFSIRIGLGNIF